MFRARLRLYKDGSTYALYLTDTDVKKDEIGNNTYVKCTKYDIKNEKVVHGTVRIDINKAPGTGEYPYIRGDVFKENE